MSRVTISTQHLHLQLDVKPSADFISCLITALVGALPTFLQAFMSCLAGGGTPGDYKPGDRLRCA